MLLNSTQNIKTRIKQKDVFTLRKRQNESIKGSTAFESNGMIMRLKNFSTIIQVHVYSKSFTPIQIGYT